MNSSQNKPTASVLSQSLTNAVKASSYNLYNCNIYSFLDNLENERDKIRVSSHTHDICGEDLIHTSKLVLAETRSEAEIKFLKSLGIKDLTPFEWYIDLVKEFI